MGSSVGSDCRHGGGTTAKTTDTAWYYTETRGFNSCIVRLDQDGKEDVYKRQGVNATQAWRVRSPL